MALVVFIYPVISRKVRGKLIPFLENSVGHASALTILAISIERYRVAFGVNPQRRKSRLIAKTFVGIWICSILSALPSILITKYNTYKLLDGTPVPFCSTPINLLWHKIYIVVMTSLFFLFPLIIIIFLYAKLCRRLVYLYRKERTKFETSPIEIIKLKRQMIQIIITVVMVFFICHTPYRAVVIWTFFEKTETVRNFGFEAYLTILYFTRILLYANHAINPFVYNFVSRKFRRALIWICCHKRHKLTKFDYIDNPLHSLPLRRLSERHIDVRSDDFLFNDYRGRSREGFQKDNRNHINDFLALYEHLVLLE
ncbi:hypothetical protein LOTGIDRAFT_155864 [Lottia gigantea]|uniref:G-protein coupled receptors family 1 profile domain-containing protein n=1 Tax=Lottia gigantea TaxID=225164 RepID=V4B3C0_LOTGI|nr:hypothetical protein LOTGIDRAFT_155864 [Lottia gigantea]ESO82829.1 hypothetical protein LOTGIDRAFT_155864 [Lottia gigantea]